MTKIEAVERFSALYPRKLFVRLNGSTDKPMRAEAWNNWTDSLCKQGLITLRQYESWTHPWSD